MPSFPWQGKKYWLESQASKLQRFPNQVHELLGSKADHVHGGWLNSLRLDSVPYLKEHFIDGSVFYYNGDVFHSFLLIV